MSLFSSIETGAGPRRTPRRLHYPALISGGEGMPLRNCMIWEISASGATLTVAVQDEIPDRFELLLSKDGGARRRCQAIWRSQLQIGVRFLADAEMPAVAPPDRGPGVTQLDC